MKVRVLLLFAVAGMLRPQEISHRTSPSVIHSIEPEYTKEALDAKLQGDVILSLLVGSDGIPSDIKVVRGLGKGLNEKAIDCLRQWRFSPAKIYREPVPEKATIVISFRILLPPTQKGRFQK